MDFNSKKFVIVVVLMAFFGPTAFSHEYPPTGFLQLIGNIDQVAHRGDTSAKTKPASTPTAGVAAPAKIGDLNKQLDESKKPVEKKSPTRTEASNGCAADNVLHQVPVIVEREHNSECGGEPDTKPVQLRFLAEYNKGFLIRPIDAKRDPFQLKVNAWIQFRRVGFNRDRDSWTDNAGVTRPIRNRNAFDIERSRLVFSGFAIDERLTYFLQLDGDTDGREVVDFFDYWWAWKHSDALRIQLGKRKVPGSRQWLLGARDTRFVDRPIATDFFRPDRTTGVFASGKLDDGVFYELMVGNGYRTSNRNSGEINGKFAVAGTSYWEPTGAFGKDLTDHDLHEDAVYRIGHSLTWSAQNGLNPDGTPLRETDFLRLSDGTRLLQIGALAPGVTVSEFDVTLYSVDVATKYQGWSFNSEFYFQWLNGLGGDGALPISNIYRRGFFVEGGSVIVPEKLDWNVRYSEVTGPYGKASEYGAGFNFYPIDSRNVKITVDLTKFDQSPLNNTPTEVLAGESGTLLRTQVQAEF